MTWRQRRVLRKAIMLLFLSIGPILYYRYQILRGKPGLVVIEKIRRQ